MSGTSLARPFEMSQPGVVYAVNKGEKIAKERSYQLLKALREVSGRQR